MKKYSFKQMTQAFLMGAFFFTASVFAEDEFLSDEEFFMEDLNGGSEISDPLEFINRYTFEFNDFVYLNLLEPLANAYQTVTPDHVEQGATNFFRNLGYPVRLASNVLQGRVRGAWVETGRFAINSTVGLFGVLDPADQMDGFERIPSEDIGQALGSWGVGEGPYLVLPFLGPSNARDFAGYGVGRVVNPLQEPYTMVSDWDRELRWGLTAVEFINASPSILERYERLKGSAIDPYSALKRGYTEFRRGQIER